jgi:hypothetical protein
MENKDKNDNDRLFVFEPNPEDNGIIANEDLSIYVQLETTRKSRSFITVDGNGNGTLQETQGGETSTIKFIGGSNINYSDGSDSQGLTTNYTDVNSMFDETDNNRDLEALGIENIDITFGTDYTPVVKIKFIDVRGHSILQQGEKSKYSVFFSLPYPIFELTIKGYFGKPVKYCLHLMTFKSTFNSQTGNLEIDAEFIGYTYAILTDMLLGLLRAVILTPEGKPHWNALVEEYANTSDSNGNPIVLKSIDEFIKDAQRLDEEFNKLKNNDDDIIELTESKLILEGIKYIKNQLSSLSRGLLLDGDDYFNNGKGVICVKPGNEDVIKSLINSYLVDIESYLNNVENGINNKITNNSQLKFDTKSLTTIDILNEMSAKLLSKDEEDAISEIANTQVTPYNNKNNSGTIYMAEETVENIKVNDDDEDSKVIIIYFNNIYKELERVSEVVSDNNEIIRTNIGKKLSDIATNELGFQPNIKNFVRILTSHAEVFMKTLGTVSFSAEKNTKRTAELRNIVKDLDVKESDKNIYPWPEYKELKNGIYEETWLGKAKNINTKPINEIQFVENMLTVLLTLAESDENILTLFGTEINGPQYYPVSVLDTYMGSYNKDNDSSVKYLINKNPYEVALTDTYSKTINDEITRCLLMRGFLSLDVNSSFIRSNDNSGLSNEQIILMGKLEADNLYNALETLDKSKADVLVRWFIDGANNSESIFKTWEVGSNKVTNPNGSITPLFRESKHYDNDFLTYTYISNYNTEEEYGLIDVNIAIEMKTYLPISGPFDGRLFFNGDELKNNETVKKDLTNYSYISHGKTYIYEDEVKNADKVSDGSTFFNIIDANTYESNKISPTYGSDVLNEYNESNKVNLIKQDSLRSAAYENKLIKTFNPYLNSKKVLEITNMEYNGNDDEGIKGGGNISILSSYFTDFTNYTTSTNKSTSIGSNFLSLGLNEITSKKYEFTTTDDNDRYSIIYKPKAFTERVAKFKEYGQQKKLLSNLLINSDISSDIYISTIDFSVIKNDDKLSDATLLGLEEFKPQEPISLFGNQFYYEQDDNGKAFLFLHSFNWTGMVGDNKNELNTFLENDLNSSLFEHFGDDDGSDDKTVTLKGLYQRNNSFIQAPKLWLAFLGGLLVRYESPKDIINWYTEVLGETTEQKIIPGIEIPQKNELLYHGAVSKYGITFIDETFEEKAYTKVDAIILSLPISVKEKLKNYFNNFVRNDFIINVKKELELSIFSSQITTPYDVSNELWTQKSIGKDDNPKTKTNGIYKDYYLDKKYLEQYFSEDNLKNYSNISPIAIDVEVEIEGVKTIELSTTGDFKLLIRKKSRASKVINNLLQSYEYIENGKPIIFKETNNGSAKNVVRKDEMKTFIKSFVNRVEKLAVPWLKRKDDKTDLLENKIFNNSDDDKIKLQLYRTLASSYGKWVAGSNGSDSVFTQCGSSNSYDNIIAKKERGRLATPKLIDSFRFIDRAYNNIGDDFYIDPFLIQDLILGKYNNSLFTTLDRLLRENNFNFIPLPTFINFNNLDEVTKIFKAVPYIDMTKDKVASGPSFICSYMGQGSTNLDLGNTSDYKDDGIVVSLDNSGEIISSTIPPDYLTGKKGDGTLKIPYFLVSYARQNQHFFKDLKLSQNEFTETMETLQNIEDISQSGDKRKSTFTGQNLWNVYQKRAYSAEITMMGNPMIQPFMYFQLDDINLYRGAYTIYKVSHKITPNFMETTFTGNRVRKTKTPLLDKTELFMNLLSRFNTEDSSNSTTSNRKTVSENSELNILRDFIDTDITINMLPINNGKHSDEITKNSGLIRIPGYDEGGNRVPTLRFGIREVVELLQLSIKEFYNENINSDFNNTVFTNDLSKYKGGVTSKHTSHQIGEDIDLRQITTKNNLGTIKPENISFSIKSKGNPNSTEFFHTASNSKNGELEPYKSPNGITMNLISVDDDREFIGYYSRKGTRTLINKLIELGGKEITSQDGKLITILPKIEAIWFNDPVLVEEFKNKITINTLVNHDNHLHIRFDKDSIVRGEGRKTLKEEADNVGNSRKADA